MNGALAPLTLTGGTAISVLLVVGASRNRAMALLVTLVGLAVALLALVYLWPPTAVRVGDLLMLDHFALMWQGVFLGAAALLCLIGSSMAGANAAASGASAELREEYYVLVLTAALGSMVLAAATHFVSLFLGLELLSVSLYGLIALRSGRALGIEAAVKYLVLAGVSSAFLLLGMALIYARCGTMELGGLLAAVQQGQGRGLVLAAGLGLLGVAAGFKLALVPFHLWTPDVYQGAPAPVSALIASVSKAGVFLVLLRYAHALQAMSPHEQWAAPLRAMVVAAAALSMLAGNLLALRQANLKRLLGYSSIAHMGYLLIAVLIAGPAAALVGSFYLLTYMLAVVAAFAVVAIVSETREGLAAATAVTSGPGGTQGDSADLPEAAAEQISAYRGLVWRRPWLAAALVAALLSLAGLPLTAGFTGKFVLALGGVAADLWLLLILLVVSSTIGLYYYLRVVVTVFGGDPADERPAGPRGPAVPAAGLALGVLALLILVLGVYPAPLLAALREVVAGFPY